MAPSRLGAAPRCVAGAAVRPSPDRQCRQRWPVVLALGALALGLPPGGHPAAAAPSPAAFSSAASSREGRKSPPPEGLLIVLNKTDSTVSFFQARASRRSRERLRHLKTLPTGQNPHEVAVTPDGKEAWVSNAGADTVGVYDLGRLEQVATIRHEGFGFPHGSAFTPDGGKFYLACTETNTVFAIDRSTRQVLRAIPTGQIDSHMVAMAPDGARIYVPNIGSRVVTVISTSEDRVVGEVRVGRGPEGITVLPDSRQVLVANQEDSTISIIDAAELRVVDAFEVGEFPVRVIVSPDGMRAFSADRKGNTVTAIRLEGEHTRVMRRIAVGKSPGGLAFDASGGTLFVALNNEAKVALVNTRTLRKVRTIRVGNGPDGIAFVAGWSPAAPD